MVRNFITLPVKCDAPDSNAYERGDLGGKEGAAAEQQTSGYHSVVGCTGAGEEKDFPPPMSYLDYAITSTRFLLHLQQLLFGLHDYDVGIKRHPFQQTVLI